MARTAALIVAAGRGTRMNSAPADAPKQYRLLGGRPVIARTAGVFLQAALIDEVRVVIHARDGAAYETAMNGLDGLALPVTGGASRQQSVHRGLLALREDPPDIVLIHDGARPLLSETLLSRLIQVPEEYDGQLAALPVTDTLKQVDNGGRITGTRDRAGLWAAQTPQVFRYPAILAAHQAADRQGRTEFTDDAALAEWAGLRVRVVEGQRRNLKITLPEDLKMAEFLLEQDLETRLGSGFDVHAFTAGKAVMLGGVEIPCDQALAGHSDADVLLHALTDALLGAIGAGDIGTHFPPSDPQWKGASSDVFLRHACDLTRRQGGEIIHLDGTLICEAPKLGPHRAAMRRSIAAICGVPVSRISLKATTTERLGFTGRREGIAAMASATVRGPAIGLEDDGS